MLIQKKVIMYAYDYGVRNFNKKYQPFPNITVFNDQIEVLDQSSSLFSEVLIYKQVTLDENNNSYARITPSGIEYSDLFTKEYLQKFGQFQSTGETRNIVGFSAQREIFEFKGNYFVFNPEIVILDEVVVTAKGTGNKKKFAPDLTLLSEQLQGSELSVILFITKDGAKLERAYQKIDQFGPNEIVMFVEKDDAYNTFGSVIRVNSGDEITESTEIPFNDIAKLTKTFEIGVNSSAIKDVLEDHVKDKDSVFYLIRNVFQKGIEVVNIPANFALEKVADAMDAVSKGIEDNLKIGSKYWKAYDQEGNPDKTYSPILPGFELIEQLETLNENIDYDQLLSGFTQKLDALESQLQTGIDKIPFQLIRDFVKEKVSVLFDFINEGKSFLKEVASQVLLFTKSYFIFLNSFLVGLINSLVDVIKGIFDLIGLICKIVIGINKAHEQTAKTPASMFSLFVELFENAMETTAKLFTLKNIKAFFKFMIGLFVKFLTSPPSISSDKLGYGIGYLIGFIVEEVVFAILTGGAKTVGTALKLAADSYKSLIRGVYRASKKAIKFTIDGILTIIREIQKQLNDFPKLLDDLGKWLDEVLQVGKKIDAYAQFAKGLIRALQDLGVDIARTLLNGTERAVVTQYGDVIYEGPFQNFFNALTDFNKKAGVNRNQLKQRLDEIASGLNEEMLSILKKKKLKVERKPRATKTLDVVDRNGKIVFRGLPDDVPKFLEFINKPLEQRRKLISEMQKTLRGKTTKYNQLKTLDKGYDIPTSKSGTSPDFDGLTEYLYQGNAKFGKVKIKITGSRDVDFAQANELMKLDEIPEGYTWHHLDDLDENLEGTMQLVKSTIHTATYKHFGSAKQLQELLDIKKYL
ncbi:HNH endonuclease [uncultured Aquimarina sp.]|uniref:HNH endonuclease n=1 Tax=uncultured Aquimarina sp. TaxID=575652 RepID=UPI002627C9C9|nr:HNH endonuclease [uncultured Aquimarina sp.]